MNTADLADETMNAPALAQQTTAAVMPSPQTGGFISGLQDSCAKHSGFALGLIVVLLVVILYLLACQYGWLAPAGPAPRSKKSSKSGRASKSAPRGDDSSGSDEIDDLIAEIESPV